MTVTIFEFPYKHENYGAAHSMEEIDGETWFTAGSSFAIPLGHGKSGFEYAFTPGDNTSTGYTRGTGLMANLKHSQTLKFKVNVEGSGTLKWKFGYSFGRNPGSDDSFYRNVYVLTLDRLREYGASGLTNVTIKFTKTNTRGYNIYSESADGISLYVNGNLAEEASDSYAFTERLAYDKSTAAIHRLEVTAGVQIASVIMRLSDSHSMAVEAFMKGNHKVVQLKPVTQIGGEGQLPLNPLEFTSGFNAENTAIVRFDTDIEPEAGANFRAVTAIGNARFRRRSSKYGTANSTLTVADKSVTHFDSVTASGARSLSLLNVGVNTWTKLNGHVQLNSADPESMRVIGVNVNISHTNG